MIVSFEKTFPDKASAINGRKELDDALRLYHRRLPNCYRIEIVAW
jgi:hypothetical protein